MLGVVGKTNVGKSTLFMALTMQPVEVGNRPFVTIEPNRGVGYVRVEDPGPSFGVASQPRYGFVRGRWRFVPVELLDVAGLVPGAHEGRGLGNKFLDDLRRGEGFILVVDAVGATDAEGQPVPKGSRSPVEDVRFVVEELTWWMFGVVKRNLERVLQGARFRRVPVPQVLAEVLAGLEVPRWAVEQALRETGVGEYDYDALSDDPTLFRVVDAVRRIGKPFVIAANKVDADIDLAKRFVAQLRSEFPGVPVIPTSGLAEYLLKKWDAEGVVEYVPGEPEFRVRGQLGERERKALAIIEQVFAEFGGTGVQRALEALVFDVLGYVAVFPVAGMDLRDREGRVLPDCYLMPRGSTVIDLAAAVHSELARKFVRAVDVRSRRELGKDYVLRHGDVIHIVASR